MTIKIYKDIPQRSEEWYTLRSAKLTASNASTIMANGKGLETYVYSLMADYYSNAEKEHYMNSDMQRGVELEPEAKIEFQFYTGLEVEEVCFVELNDYCGVSPDGLVGDDALIEVKCPNDQIYFKLLIDGKIKPEYIAQIQMQLFVTNRKKCYFVSYNPNFTDKTLFIKVIERDEKMIAKIQKGIEDGTKLIKEIKQKYEKIIGEKQNGKIW